jgi:integrase
MPKQRTNDEVQGQYYRWILTMRSGVYYADGRSNPNPQGRHSLGVDERDKALQALRQLDQFKAVEQGLAARSILDETAVFLPVVDGWTFYMNSIEGRRAIEAVSAKTLKRYRAVRDKFITFCQKRGITNCRQITKARLLEYAAWLAENDYAYATRYLELTTIKQLIRFLIEENHLPASSAFKLKVKKPQETDTYCYTPVEVETILNHCQANKDLDWLYRVIATLIYTGMRISEVASLRWTDIDLERAVIKLTDERHSAARRRQGDVRELKGRRSRSFPIHGMLQPILKAIPASRDGLVFHGQLGGRIKPDTVRRFLVRELLTPLKGQFPKPAGAAVGFIDGRVHSFRHFFCSICANSNIAEQALMVWLGHQSSKMIKRYYHLHDEAAKEAMAKFRFGVVEA